MIVYELIKTVAEAYKNPAEGEEDRNGNTHLTILQEKYHLSSLKVQKILVTAGVYEPVKEGTPYAEITQLRKAGKSVKARFFRPIVPISYFFLKKIVTPLLHLVHCKRNDYYRMPYGAAFKSIKARVKQEQSPHEVKAKARSARGPGTPGQGRRRKGAWAQFSRRSHYWLKNGIWQAVLAWMFPCKRLVRVSP